MQPYTPVQKKKKQMKQGIFLNSLVWDETWKVPFVFVFIHFCNHCSLRVYPLAFCMFDRALTKSAST